VADVAIKDGRVGEVGRLNGEGASNVIDATGLVVTPGFVDVHTHFDAQLHWDPYATPSSLHGVTTVIGGNCGFTIAPLKFRDAAYMPQMLAQVEGMPAAALEAGLQWRWESFSEYLDSLDGRTAVNAAFFVGHSALRLYVMGQESLERQATEAEIQAMVAVLEESLQGGGLGFSSSRVGPHVDHNGRPVPSRQASDEEISRLCQAVGRHPGTSLEFVTNGVIDHFSDDEIEFVARLSADAKRPLSWAPLFVGSNDGESERLARQLRPSSRSRQLGGRVVPLTLPVAAESIIDLASPSIIWTIPGWREVLSAPVPERTARLRDARTRIELRRAAEQSGIQTLVDFGSYRISETVAPQNKGYEGQLIADIAQARGVDPWDVLVDIEAEDQYQTVLLRPARTDSQELWEMRRDLWRHRDVVLGASDAGAHVNSGMQANYTTRLLADTLRGRQLIGLEEAVQLLTQKPAELYGLKDRGTLTEGAYADIVIFDPETVDSEPPRRVWDLPAGSLRITASATGIQHVLVNGREAIRAGTPTGDEPGRILRSGRDTQTPRL
jgi:N-acyl-D-aspartate/D-glutamate deacylase